MNEIANSILRGINSVVGNYGWSIVVFTLFIRLLMLPFDYKSRVGMRKTAKIQPKVQALQAKYGKDQEKLNRKMSELYKEEKVSPLSGCLPMLISWPFIIWMWSAMRAVADEQVVRMVIELLKNNESMPVLESWLWIRNVWMPDSPFSSALPEFNSMRQVASNVWQNLMTTDTIATLPEQFRTLTVESFSSANLNATLQSIYDFLKTTPVYIEHGGELPGWNINFFIIQVSLMKEANGLFLLPIFSCVSQFLMTKMTGQQQPTADASGQQAQSTMKMVNWFFPIFSLWICAQYNGAFALYWVTSNVIMMFTTLFIRNWFSLLRSGAGEPN